MLSRRELLNRAGGGFGSLALAYLLDRDRLASAFDPTPPPADPLAVRQPHYPAKAERVISLFMDGGPSHLDTWDYKPELAKHAGEAIPESIAAGAYPLWSYEHLYTPVSPRELRCCSCRMSRERSFSAVSPRSAASFRSRR